MYYLQFYYDYKIILTFRYCQHRRHRRHHHHHHHHHCVRLYQAHKEFPIQQCLTIYVTQATQRSGLNVKHL